MKKVLNEIQLSFLMKTLRKLRLEENFLTL